MDSDGILAWLAAKARWQGRGVRHNDLDHCLNCREALSQEQLYCPNCGQKIHESKLTVWSLIAEFFAGIFNLDNGFYRSLRYIAWPSYLTKEFMQGRRKKYLNPIRFFIVALVVHIAAINYIADLDDLGQFTDNQLQKVGEQHMYEDYKAIRDSSGTGSPEFYAHIDSTLFKGYTSGDEGTFFDESVKVLGVDLKELNMTRADAFEMPISEILTKYKVEGWTEKIIVGQSLRAMRDPVGAVRQAIGAILWGVLLAIFLTGLLMKLLYIRKDRYYVEHLILLFHIHTFSFIVATIMFLIAFFCFAEPNGELAGASYVIAGLYFFAAIKSYYGQGWIKSIFKFLFIGFVYFIILTSAIVMVGLVSLLFFK